MIADIADKKYIPIKFLESILLLLKQQYILQSKKGKGDYSLTKNPRKKSIENVVRIIGGPIALLPCASLDFEEKIW